MSSFINILKPIRRHYNSFVRVDAHGRRHVMKRELTAQLAVPVIGGASAFFLPASTVAMSDLLAGVALIAGALFALVVLVFELQLGRSKMSGSVPRNNRIQLLIDELFHNALYAGIVSGATCVAIILLSIFDFGRLGFAIVAALGIHLGLAGLMCIKRLSEAFVSLRREQDDLASSRFSDHA